MVAYVSYIFVHHINRNNLAVNQHLIIAYLNKRKVFQQNPSNHFVRGSIVKWTYNFHYHSLHKNTTLCLFYPLPSANILQNTKKNIK